MVSAPQVEDPRKWDFEYNDREEMIFKQNALNQWRFDFSEQLKTMCDELTIEFQFVKETRIDITEKAGQVAADRQHVDSQKKAVDNVKTHVDQQREQIDTTAGQVNATAQQVAEDKAAVAQDRQAAAQAAGAAGDSASAAEQSKNDAENLYGNLDAVRAARDDAEQSSQTAGQQAQAAGQERGKAETAREGAEEALKKAIEAAEHANVDIDAVMQAHVEASDPHNQYAKKEGNETFNGTKRFQGALELLRSSIALAFFAGNTQLAFAEAGEAYGLRFRTRVGGAGAGLAETFTLSNAAEGGISWTGPATGDGSGIKNVNAAKLRTSGVEVTPQEAGLDVRTLDNNGAYIFRVRSSGGAERFKVAHDAAPLVGGSDGWRINNDLVLHEGSDVNAAKLAGLLASIEPARDTIVRRDGNGDIKARLFRSSFTGTDTANDVAAIYTTRNLNGTDFIRQVTPATLKVALNLNNVANTDQRNAGNLTSGTVNIARINSTSSRSSSSTNHLLTAKAMNDHRGSSDHDGRYYTKGQVDNLVDANTVPTGLNASGTYAILLDLSGGVTLPGQTRNASVLAYARPSSTNYSAMDERPTGTWRLMSERTSSNTNHEPNKGLWVKL